MHKEHRVHNAILEGGGWLAGSLLLKVLTACGFCYGISVGNCLDTSAFSTRWQRDKEMTGGVPLYIDGFTEAEMDGIRCEGIIHHETDSALTPSTVTSFPVPSSWVGKHNRTCVWCVERWSPHFASVTLNPVHSHVKKHSDYCESRLDRRECVRKHSLVSYVNFPQDTTDVSWWAMTGVASSRGFLLFIIPRWWWSWSCWTALIHVCSLVSCLTYLLTWSSA